MNGSWEDDSLYQIRSFKVPNESYEMLRPKIVVQKQPSGRDFMLQVKRLINVYQTFKKFPSLIIPNFLS